MKTYPSSSCRFLNLNENLFLIFWIKKRCVQNYINLISKGLHFLVFWGWWSLSEIQPVKLRKRLVFFWIIFLWNNDWKNKTNNKKKGDGRRRQLVIRLCTRHSRTPGVQEGRASTTTVDILQQDVDEKFFLHDCRWKNGSCYVILGIFQRKRDSRFAIMF